MSTGEQERAETKTNERHQVIEEREERPPTEKPEVSEEHKQKAKEMAKDYDDTRPTIKMPGTDGAVSGTAVNEWIDDEGKPKYQDESEKDR
jgi:hypothetical protein